MLPELLHGEETRVWTDQARIAVRGGDSASAPHAKDCSIGAIAKKICLARPKLMRTPRRAENHFRRTTPDINIPTESSALILGEAYRFPGDSVYAEVP